MAKTFSGLGDTVGLAADRTAMTNMNVGQRFYETDTKDVYVYTGSAWVKCNDFDNAYGMAFVDSWHYVGGAGEPAFQNSWTNYDVTWASARFKKDITNTVFIEGLVRSGTAATIFTLPVGYRPTNATNNMFTGLTNPNVVLRFNITNTGIVVLDASYSNTWASITCSFKAE